MWNKISGWFYNSETIAWARIQLLVGAVWTVLLSTDLSPIISGEWLTYWLVFSGVVTELLRRKGTVVDQAGDLIKTNVTPDK